MKKNKAEYSSIRIMYELSKLLRPLAGTMVLAITFGTLGFLSAFALSVSGLYALISIMPVYASRLPSLPLGDFSTEIYIRVLIGSAVLRGLLHYAEQFCNHLIAFKILAEIRDSVFAAMRRLAPAKLETKNQGKLISIIMEDIELLEVFYAHTVSPVVIACITTVVLAVFFLQIHPSIALLVLAGQITVGIIFPVIAAKKGVSAASTVREKISDLNAEFLDKMRGVREIIQHQMGKTTAEEITQNTVELVTHKHVLTQQRAVLTASIDTAIIVFSVLQFLLSGFLLHSGIVSVPQAAVSVLLQLSIFAPYINLASLGNTLTHTVAAGNRVLSLLQELPQTPEKVDGVDSEFGTVCMNDVSFTYHGNSLPAVNQVNLTIQPNELVGINGKSGCGKSTLLKLLLRFWDPQTGGITLNTHNLKTLNTASLYRMVNYMTQTTVLFTGTIRENLLVAKENAHDDDLYAALKQSGLYEFVHSLPKKLDERVGEGGANFSGGERQRMGLARCFLADRNMFILDEPTSNLDSQNESIILQALANQAQGKTIILVSHRRSTLGICNRIVQMEKGLIEPF